MRRQLSGASSTTEPRLPMPTLLSRKSRRPKRSTHGAALRLLGEVGPRRDRVATFAGNHGNAALGEGDIAIDDEDADAGAGEQDRRRAAVADAIAGGATAGDDGNLAG